MAMNQSKVRIERRRMYLPVTNFSGIQQKALTGNAEPIDTVLQSAGAQNPLLKEINNTGVMGLLVTNAGDDIRTLVALPSDLDRKLPTRFRLWWTSAAAAVGARDITWLLLYRGLRSGVSELVAGDTALNTPIPVAVPTGAAHTIEKTGWGVLNGGVANDNLDAISILVEADAFNGAFVEAKYLLGLEIEYTAKGPRGATKPRREGAPILP